MPAVRQTAWLIPLLLLIVLWPLSHARCVMLNLGLYGVAIDRGALYVCTHGLFSSNPVFDVSPPGRYPIEMSAAWGTAMRPWQPVRHLPGLWIVRFWFMALVYAALAAFALRRSSAHCRGKRGFDVNNTNADIALEPPPASRV
jgi:hypothetical protein